MYPRTTYAMPSSGGTTQLEQNSGGAEDAGDGRTPNADEADIVMGAMS
jgi:hypothetical protein